MPELPEVETVRRGLIPKLVGRRIVRVVQRRKDLRLPLPKGLPSRLTGRRVTAIDRRAKYLLIRLDDGQVLLAHLGMSGRMRLLDRGEARAQPFERHDHVVIETDHGWQIRFNDPRRFGLMRLLSDREIAQHPPLARLGPEPLATTFDAASASE